MSKECKHTNYLADDEGFIDGWWCNLRKDWCFYPDVQDSCKDYEEEDCDE